jgi:LysR family hydrogen peroxide-inducible transcriptional activator
VNRWAPHPLTLRQLQYVVAVAEQRSFRRAAEVCAVAQPSLSAQVAALEDALGVRIFERLPRGVVVTEAGAAILEQARRTLLAAGDLVAGAERLRDPFSGTLRIGIIPTIAPYLLPEVAKALRGRFPKLGVLWEEERTRLLVERIAAGELDAGMLAVESELGDLAVTPVGRDPFFLATAKDHPLAASREPARLEALEGETVLLLEDGHCFRDQALSVCQRAGGMEASVRATSLSTLAQMVAGGAGVTLLPGIALRNENRARTLAVRPFGPRGPSRTLALAWRKTSPAAPALIAVAETIRGVLDADRL